MGHPAGARHADLIAVVPVFNEAATVGAIVRGLRTSCPVVVVDDGSTDASAQRAASAGAACVVRHSRRLGKGAALRTGFAEALRRGAGSVATLDGDGQHDPADLPRLVAVARAIPDALVVGDRFHDRSGDRMPPLRSVAIRLADRVLRRLTGSALQDTQCGFRVYPAGLLRSGVLRREGFVLEAEALVEAARMGYPIVSSPVRRVYLPGRRSRFRTLPDAGRIACYLAREAARDAGQRLRGAAVPGRLAYPGRAGER